VHLADWPDARPDWTDDCLAGEMRDVRKIVKLAREGGKTELINNFLSF
jgi:hypothetical protein